MHVVRQGEFLDLIAWRHGVAADQIWQHPANEAVRAERGEGNVLHPGDVLFVPDAEQDRLPLRKGQTNAFLARIPTVQLRVRVTDENGPIAGEAFTVEGGDREPVNGSTDGDGVAEFEAPMNSPDLVLRLPGRSRVFRVAVGHLDPVTEESGVDARLRQLGHLRPGDDPERDRSEAVRSFQAQEGLEATGETDDATRAALLERHGS